MGERQQALGRFTADLALSTFFTEIIHAQNFDRSREHIAQKKGSLLIYANHFHRLDPVAIARTIKDNIAPLDENVSVVISMQYTDPNRAENKQLVKAVKLLQQAYGFNLLSVVQDKQTEKDIYPKSRRINYDVFTKAVELLQTPGNIVCIYPEGTRSEVNALLPAKNGLESILKNAGDSVLVQPIALPHTRISPLTMRTQIFVPEPFTYQELLEEQGQNPQFDITTLAMRRIAKELKPQNRGPYII